MRIKFFIVALCFSFFAQAQKKHQVVATGYVKLLGTFNNTSKSFIGDANVPQFLQPLLPYSSQDYQIHNRFNFWYYGPKGFSAGVGMRNRVFSGYNVRSFQDNQALFNFLGYPSFTDFVAFPSTLDLSITWWENRNSVFYTVFDRAWLQWENQKWRFRLGRQRINWGINTAFNPNDLFNQYNFFDFDYEERPGVDAVLGQYYINSRSSIEAAFTPGADSIENSTGAVLFRTNKWKYDWQFLAGYYQGDLAIGGGWAGNIKNAGFKGEATFFEPLETGSERSLVISSNIDYSFKNGIYVALGYIFNQLGEASPGVIEQATIANQQLTAKNLFPYKNTFNISLSYNITPLLTANVSWLQTPNFSSAIAVPQLSYSILQNLDFLILGQLFFSENPQDESLDFFSSSIFTRLKYSF